MNDTSPSSRPARPPPAPAPAPDSATGPGGTPPGRRPRRGAFAASVVTASLLVGGAAGVGGAAAWDEWHPGAARHRRRRARAPRRRSSTPRPAPRPTARSSRSRSRCCPRSSRSTSRGAAGGRLGLRHHPQLRRQDPHQQPRGRDGRRARGTIRVSFNDGTPRHGQDPRHRPAHRHRRDPGPERQRASPRRPSASPPTSQVGQGVVAIGSPFGLESPSPAASSAP